MKASFTINSLQDEPTEVLSDSEQMLEWYSQAALADGNPGQLGISRISGAGGGGDWFFSAANQGDSYACYTLGRMYGQGLGMPENPIKAAMWLSKAAGAGISVAQYELGKRCWFGVGVSQDMKSAEDLFQKALHGFTAQASAKPSAFVQMKLAALYEYGLGVPQDSRMAAYWRTQADQSHAAELPEPTPVVPLLGDERPEALPLAEPESLPLPVPQPKKKPQKTHKPAPPKIQKQKDNQVSIQDFLDMITPSVIDFHSDYYVCGNTFRCVWAIREYPNVTEDNALLRELGEMDGVTLRIYTRPVTPTEENKIIDKAEKRNRFKLINAKGIQDTVNAKEDLNDVVTLVTSRFREKESLVHCAVFLELAADSRQKLQELKQKVLSFCSRSKLVHDGLWLMQKEGFQSVMLSGSDRFKGQYERVLPAGSVANLYPFSYSGKTDPHGFLIGQAVNGSNMVIDPDQRTPDITNGNIVILGNSGQGKSHLMKGLIIGFRQAHKKFYVLDPDDEYRDLTVALGGCYLDMMAGKYYINVLEPRIWALEDADETDDSPIAFQKSTRISQHIAYLRDFFRCYKEFSPPQLDTLEILLGQLYKRFKIDDSTDFTKLSPKDYPILSDLFDLANERLEHYGEDGNPLYTKPLLQELTLGLRSICVGAESKYFNGHTNIVSADFIDFSIKDMLNTNENLKNAMFLNLFSYMSHKFLTEGNTEIAIDELHLFLSNRIAIDYLRSFEKRGRKKGSGVITASQNVEDLMLPGIVEYTKPLLSIPAHCFLFNPGGNVDVKEFQRLLSLQECEYDLIKEPNQGYCLYKCGSERYHLHVQFPEYKTRLFGTAGGK